MQNLSGFHIRAYALLGPRTLRGAHFRSLLRDPGCFHLAALPPSLDLHVTVSGQREAVVVCEDSSFLHPGSDTCHFREQPIGKKWSCSPAHLQVGWELEHRVL